MILFLITHIAVIALLVYIAYATDLWLTKQYAHIVAVAYALVTVAYIV
jgi:hypothetical protein